MSVHKSRAPQFTLVFSGVYHVHFKRYTDVATDLSLTWTTLYTLQTMSYIFFFYKGCLQKIHTIYWLNKAPNRNPSDK